MEGGDRNIDENETEQQTHEITVNEEPTPILETPRVEQHAVGDSSLKESEGNIDQESSADNTKDSKTESARFQSVCQRNFDESSTSDSSSSQTSDADEPLLITRKKKACVRNSSRWKQVRLEIRVNVELKRRKKRRDRNQFSRYAGESSGPTEITPRHNMVASNLENSGGMPYLPFLYRSQPNAASCPGATRARRRRLRPKRPRLSLMVPKFAFETFSKTAEELSSISDSDSNATANYSGRISVPGPIKIYAATEHETSDS